MRRWLVWCWAVVVALLLSAPAASAADGEPLLPDGSYTYSGQISWEDGSSEPMDATVACAGGACTVTLFGVTVPAADNDGIAFTDTRPYCPTVGPQTNFFSMAVTAERIVGGIGASATFDEPECVIEHPGGTYRLTNTAPPAGQEADDAGDAGDTGADGDTGGDGAEDGTGAGSGDADGGAGDDAESGAAGPGAGGDGTRADRDGRLYAGLLGSSPSLEGGAADAPSVLSALPTPGQLELDAVLVAVAATVVLTILMVFPTMLLSSAVEDVTTRTSAWWRHRRGLLAPAEVDRRWWWALLGVFCAAVIASFVDPHVALDAGSARLLGSVLAALAVSVVLSWVVTTWLVRRAHPGAEATYTFKPPTLLIAVGTVVFSRVTDFQPGIVFGAVAGVGFAAVAGARGEARVQLVQLVWGFALGVVGWLGYAALGAQSSAAGVFASETLAGLTVGGFAAMPLALVLLRGFAGRAVFAWSPAAWAATYAVGLLGFLVVLLPTPSAWGEVSWSLRVWVLAYAAYCVVAVVVWLLARQRPAPPAAAEGSAAPMGEVTP